MNRIELIKGTQDDFDKACNNADIESLKVWNCKIKDFSGLFKQNNLVELEIFCFETESLSILSHLAKLKKLRIIHLPKIEDLSPLSSLSKLTYLALESLPSWDVSRKTLLFNNFEPLSKLSQLETLVFMKAKVKEKGLYPLSSLSSLKEFITDNTFTLNDFAFLSASLPSVKCKYFKSFNEVGYSICRKCGSNKVLLTGSDYNRCICPKCQIDKLYEHSSIFGKARKESGLDSAVRPGSEPPFT